MFQLWQKREYNNDIATRHAIAALALAHVHRAYPSEVAGTGTRRMGCVRAPAAGELRGQHSRSLSDHADRVHPTRPVELSYWATHARHRPGSCPLASLPEQLCRLLCRPGCCALPPALGHRTADLLGQV